MPNNRKNASGQGPLSADDAARLDTYMLALAAEKHGEGRLEASGDYRFGHNDSLVIHSNGGYWHDFAAGVGGHGTWSLLVHLHGQAAGSVALAFLAGHAGDGALGRGDGVEDDEAKQSLLDAERESFIDGLLLQYSRPIEECPEAMRYFADERKLDIVSTGAAAQLRVIPNWRGNETAILIPVTDNVGALVALQILHITPEGKKSSVLPVRRILRGPRDWRRRGAFRLGAASVTHLTEVEGVEDAIAARMADPAGRAHACLGAGGVGRAELPSTVSNVVVGRDDDPCGSAACLQLGRGVARVMLQGRTVKITPRAGTLKQGCKDAADLAKADLSLARQYLDDAGFLKNNLDAAEKEAFLDEVSHANTDSYELNRVALATALGWRVSALDDDRNKRRQARAKQGDDPATQNIEAEPWPDPVLDVGAVLDAAVAEFKRFLVVPDPTYFDTMALWAAHSHLLHREKIGSEIGFTPRIAFQSPTKRCGKSTALKLIFLTTHNAWMASSISASSLFRAVDAFNASIMVDEADNALADGDSDLHGIINSGADRLTAKVMRSVKDEDGEFKPRAFNSFGALAFTAIKELPETLQDRCIVLRMRRAAKHEKRERLTLRTRGPLLNISRQFARWGGDLSALPDPNLPADLFNRIEDRWFVLFQIAKAGGGDWPERCRRAALADLQREEASDAEGGKNTDLLADLWRVFKTKGKPALHTSDICSALNNMDESQWATVKGGKPLDGYYLRSHLKDFLPTNADKIAPRQFQIENIEAKGYSELHFKDAFELYLGLPTPTEYTASNLSSKPSVDPSHPSTSAESEDKSNGYSSADSENSSVVPSVDPTDADKSTDAPTDQENLSVGHNREQNQGDNAKVGGSTDPTDKMKASREGMSETSKKAIGKRPNGASDNQPPAVKPNGAGEAPPSDFQYPRGARGRGRDKPRGRAAP